MGRSPSVMYSDRSGIGPLAVVVFGDGTLPEIRLLSRKTLTIFADSASSRYPNWSCKRPASAPARTLDDLRDIACSCPTVLVPRGSCNSS